MTLQLCSLTGVDHTTDITRMRELSKRYPFIEWGVLLSESADRAKDKRYPNLEYILELNAVFAQNAHMNAALHLCGSAAHDFIKQTKDYSDYFRHFQRIQVNIISSRVKIEDLKSVMNKYGDKTFITQHNFNNELLCQQLNNLANHSVLFDASGGRGISPEIWPEKIEHKLCGYAGGLGPDNIDKQLQILSNQLNGQDFWIDMESKLRNEEDNFCLDKCEMVARSVSQHLSAKQKNKIN